MGSAQRRPTLRLLENDVLGGARSGPTLGGQTVVSRGRRSVESEPGSNLRAGLAERMERQTRVLCAVLWRTHIGCSQSDDAAHVLHVPQRPEDVTYPRCH